MNRFWEKGSDSSQRHCYKDVLIASLSNSIFPLMGKKTPLNAYK
jgi:hypothetical protein